MFSLVNENVKQNFQSPISTFEYKVCFKELNMTLNLIMLAVTHTKMQVSNRFSNSTASSIKKHVRIMLSFG